MAAQTCLRRIHFTIQKLPFNEVYLRSRALASSFETSSLILRPPSAYSLRITRTMCSKRGKGFSGDEDGNGDRDEVHTKVKPVVVSLNQGPFGWIANNLKLFLLKSIVDTEFDEKEFLRGAKQALCVVSQLLNKEQYSQLQEIVSNELLESLMSMKDDKPIKEVVSLKEILSANIQKVKFRFEADETTLSSGEGHFEVNITVAFVCTRGNGKGAFQRQLGNVKIIDLDIPKIVYLTFRKRHMLSNATGWQVISIYYI